MTRAERALEAEHCRRDAHYFVFESGYLKTKDEHDVLNPVKNFPDTLYLRATLDQLLVAGRLLEPTKAKYSLEAGVPDWWLRYLHETGILFIEKSRQVMATWLCCAYVLWRARAKPHQLVLVQSKRAEDAEALVFAKEPDVARISFMETHLPSWMRQTTWPKSGTTGHLYISHPGGALSHIWAIPEGGHIIRSNTPSVVLSDEAAFQPEFGDSYTAALPAVKGGGSYVALSSAEPGAFAELVEAA